MKRKTFKHTQCSVARSLDRVGDWWSILILRDAFDGLTRFEDFKENLEISPGILSRRLGAMVKDGLLDRVQYSRRPARYEYHLTDLGRDFRPVLLTLYAWGSKHFASKKPDAKFIDLNTGRDVEPALIDLKTGRPLSDPRFNFIATPGASERVKAKFAKRDIAAKTAAK